MTDGRTPGRGSCRQTPSPTTDTRNTRISPFVRYVDLSKALDDWLAVNGGSLLLTIFAVAAVVIYTTLEWLF